MSYGADICVCGMVFDAMDYLAGFQAHGFDRDMALTGDELDSHGGKYSSVY